MPINRIALHNFKCFKHLEIDFSKITILTGANSSGKSSVLYGLLAAFQSRGFPFSLAPNGKYVSMGDFLEMSFNGKAHEIGLDYSLIDAVDEEGGESEHHICTGWVLDTHTQMPRLNRVGVKSKFWNFEIKHEKAGEGYLVNVTYDLESYTSSQDYEISKLAYSFIESLEKASSTSKEEKPGSAARRLKSSLVEISDIKGFKLARLQDLESRLLTSGNGGALPALMQARRVFGPIGQTINYVSSFRLQPERTYYQKSEADIKVGKFGENCIEQILAWEVKKSRQFRKLCSILNDLGLLSGLRTRELKGGRFEVRVKVNNIWASLADVGFGISQFLPILVADLQMPKGSTLLVAQPEIHLHPSVQAQLADYLVEQAQKNNKRYIIETHSEYLLNRMRLLVVKGKIDPSDLRVYYFENSKAGSNKYQLEFTKDGKIENAPQGFFDTYMMDVMDIALSA